jgi:hypothetical protein
MAAPPVGGKAPRAAFRPNARAIGRCGEGRSFRLLKVGLALSLARDTQGLAKSQAVDRGSDYCRIVERPPARRSRRFSQTRAAVPAAAQRHTAFFYETQLLPGIMFPHQAMQYYFPLLPAAPPESVWMRAISGMKMAITMKPTITPRMMIRRGSMRLIKLSVSTLTSSSKVSATL